ncbi:MAG TPA: hypothetical protein DER02_06565 [Gammaproteobacteria bacterium]|nr:hypothetical protein [Gammaproteobacteria bacterium]
MSLATYCASFDLCCFFRLFRVFRFCQVFTGKVGAVEDYPGATMITNIRYQDSVSGIRFCALLVVEPLI